MTEDDERESKALGIAIAGGSIVGLLLDELVNKGLLSNNEVRGVLQRADSGIAVNFLDFPEGRNAARFISDLMRRFPQNR
jgi:hypothetical protein